MVMTIKYSLELIYHFSCGSCNKWWSIADLSSNGEIKTMFCPHCGTVHHKFEEAEELKRKTNVKNSRCGYFT